MKPPIFLFGSGRCGSTLVQRAINAHPDVVMYGEHEGFLGPIANSYHKLTQTPDVERYIYSKTAVSPELIQGPIKNRKADICWVNNFTREDVYREHRNLVLNLLAQGLDLDTVHWGFKEIRYRKGQHTLWFLREMFPESKFIVLVRDPLDTLVSGLLAWEAPADLPQDDGLLYQKAARRVDSWTEKYVYLMGHVQTNPDGLLVLKYEDLVADPESWMQKVFGLLDLDTPKLALDMFSHRVASTAEKPARDKLMRVVGNAIRDSRNTDFRKIAGGLGYL
ncbi:MAG: sulfotransferase [Pseudomonadota bacterium]